MLCAHAVERELDTFIATKRLLVRTLFHLRRIISLHVVSFHAVSAHISQPE